MSTTKLHDLMLTPLPCRSQQRRLPYRPSQREVHKMYDILNKEIFGGRLKRPEIQMGQLKKAWGWCQGNTHLYKSGSYCKIRLSDKWYCIQWFIITLAHEMAHQYQWDILGPKRTTKGKDFLMSHGPSFFQHRNRLQRHNIPLKTAFRIKTWFAYQNFSRC